MKVNKQPTSEDRIFVNYIFHRDYGIQKKLKEEKMIFQTRKQSEMLINKILN